MRVEVGPVIDGVSRSRAQQPPKGRRSTEYQTRNWYFRGYYDQLGDNFNPAVGFIPFQGFREGSLRLERTHRPGLAWLREIRTHLRRTWAHDLTGFKLVDFTRSRGG